MGKLIKTMKLIFSSGSMSSNQFHSFSQDKPTASTKQTYCAHPLRIPTTRRGSPRIICFHIPTEVEFLSILSGRIDTHPKKKSTSISAIIDWFEAQRDFCVFDVTKWRSWSISVLLSFFLLFGLLIYTIHRYIWGSKETHKVWLTIKVLCCSLLFVFKVFLLQQEMQDQDMWWSLQVPVTCAPSHIQKSTLYCSVRALVFSRWLLSFVWSSASSWMSTGNSLLRGEVQCVSICSISLLASSCSVASFSR